MNDNKNRFCGIELRGTAMSGEKLGGFVDKSLNLFADIL